MTENLRKNKKLHKNKQKTKLKHVWMERKENIKIRKKNEE